MSLEKTIFSNIIFREEYSRKVIPFLKKEYFQDSVDKLVFEIINDYVIKYTTFPTQEALMIDLSNKEYVDQKMFEQAAKLVQELENDSSTDFQFLIDQTEKFCQEKAIYNAIMQSIQIIDNKDKNLSKGSIPKILSDALAISFETNIGHSYFDDSDERYEFYHRVEDKLPFNLEYMNKITKGGVPRKTLNIILGGTGGGKSLFMCHFAADNLLMGKNVLYITMEMAAERIAERIDANLLDVTMDHLGTLTKEVYDKKINHIKKITPGKIIIKEYPTSGAGSANFRYLLGELKIKQNFIPDVIYIDYLNICASSRMKMGSNVNSYTYVKSIAEELRGLAVEFNVPIFSATQMTRSGFSSSDVGLEDTSESFGLPATADFMFAIINTDELIAMNQIMVKQLKNRYNDPDLSKRFIIGIDRSKMKLFDVEQKAQENIVDDTPVMDKTPFFQKNENGMSKTKYNKKTFENFK
jgi:replicative DNA helicase